MIELENEVGRKGERRELEGLGVSSKKKTKKKNKAKHWSKEMQAHVIIKRKGFILNPLSSSLWISS